MVRMSVAIDELAVVNVEETPTIDAANDALLVETEEETVVMRPASDELVVVRFPCTVVMDDAKEELLVLTVLDSVFTRTAKEELAVVNVDWVEVMFAASEALLLLTVDVRVVMVVANDWLVVVSAVETPDIDAELSLTAAASVSALDARDDDSVVWTDDTDEIDAASEALYPFADDWIVSIRVAADEEFVEIVPDNPVMDELNEEDAA